MLLLDLPPEIIRDIIDAIPDLRDLKSLAEVSKSLYASTLPALYKSVVVGSRHRHPRAEDLDVDSLVQSGSRTRRRLHYTEALEIDTATPQRCVHDQSTFYEDYPSSDKSRFEELTGKVITLLQKLKDHNLKAFSWSVNSCMPPKILGPDGYLVLKQAGIENMSLKTDYNCGNELYPREAHKLALTAFTKLKRLSWLGVSSREDFETLRDFFKTSADQLNELVLEGVLHRKVQSEFGNWDGEQQPGIFNSGHIFSEKILGVRPGIETVLFSSIVKLSLGSIPLGTNNSRELAYAFNIGQLQSLKLRFCPGWESLLQAICKVYPKDSLKLKSFELQSDYDAQPASAENQAPLGQSAIEHFLGHFCGLQQLSIGTSEHIAGKMIWVAVANHGDTLKSFVNHVSRRNEYQETCDQRYLGLNPEEFPKLASSTGCNPLASLKLEYIGLSCVPALLKSILGPMRGKSQLRVIHLRQSTRDLDAYPCYAFQSDVEPINPADEDYLLEFALAEPEPTDSIPVILEQQWERTSLDEGPYVKVQDLPPLTNSFHNFASWVFGESGFPSLEILAYGDFSYTGDASANVLLTRCKKEAYVEGGPPFRRVEKAEDDRLQYLLWKHWSGLTALPVNYLTHDIEDYEQEDIDQITNQFGNFNVEEDQGFGTYSYYDDF
ncbi:hypothetical protein BT63DRAFT_429309 [Microthyrium microscopicum]|uniref:F-box domain-containing protein n=1 Tax=Microthyrium microscopicum TaxID=703497 RepID=A0A6A6TWW1_9PEZI|nr:hypothetical protein BT63DRAFT_429309 [Microthyrium microscopicum]